MSRPIENLRKRKLNSRDIFEKKRRYLGTIRDLFEQEYFMNKTGR